LTLSEAEARWKTFYFEILKSSDVQMRRSKIRDWTGALGNFGSVRDNWCSLVADLEDSVLSKPSELHERFKRYCCVIVDIIY
jgi:hypothetical protein